MNRATTLGLTALLVLSSLAFAPGAQAAPAITGVSPNSGTTNGGTVVNVTGSGFLPGAVVQLVQGNTRATLTDIQVGASSIRGTTPPTPIGSPGTFQILVTNPDSSSSLSGATFTYTAVPAPVVTAFSPTSGLSIGGTTLVITGTGFSANVKPFVTVAGVPATVQSTSPTSIVAVTSARWDVLHQATSGNVVVSNPDGTVASTSSQPFTYIQASGPTLANVVPNTADSNGGTAFTLTGTNFQPGATVSFVLGTTSVAATGVGFVTASAGTQLTGKTPVLVPTGNTGYSVVIANPDGQTATLPSVFTVTSGPTSAGGTLRVTSVDPALGPSSGGTPVNIGGTGFADGPGLTVKFGQNPATNVKWVSSSLVTAITPACGVTGTQPCSGSITVTNPDGSVSSAIPAGNAFAYQTQVVITSAFRHGTASSSVDTSGTQAIDITGSGFIAPCQVYVGGVAAQVTSDCTGGTQVSVMAPAGAPGSKDIQVINADGRTATLQGAIGYTLPAPPVITGLSNAQESSSRLYTRESDNSGLEMDSNGGVVLTIKGSGFVAVKVTDPVAPHYYHYISPGVTINGAVAPVIADRGAGTANQEIDVVVPPTLASGIPADNPPSQVPPCVTYGAGATGQTATANPFAGSGCLPADIALKNLDGQSTTLASAHGSNPTKFWLAYAKAGVVSNTNSGTVCKCFSALTTGGQIKTGYDGFSGLALGKSVAGMGQTFFGPVIKAGTTPVQSQVVTSTTTVDFVVPPKSTAASVPLVAFNPDGSSATVPNGITYNPASTPSFSANSIVPNSASELGSSGDPGNDVIISSSVQTGFTAGMSVFFDTTEVKLHYPEPCGGSVVTNCFAPNGGSGPGGQSNTIRVRVPGHPEGTVNVKIVALDGQTVAVNNAFTYTSENPPTLTGVSPQTAPGVGGNHVTLTGTNLAQGATSDGSHEIPETSYLKPRVTIGGIQLDPQNVTFLNANQLDVVLPNHPAGTVAITVTNPDGKSFTMSDVFRYLGTQANVRVTPVTSGTQNGGTLVGFVGEGFDASHKVQPPVIQFGGIVAPAVAVTSSTSGLAITPAGPAGPVTLSFVDQNGQTLTFPRGFTYVTATPMAFSSISPAAGSTNGGTEVRLRGYGFSPDSLVCLKTLVKATDAAPDACTEGDVTQIQNVRFTDGSPAAPLQTLTFVTPSSPPGPVDLVVTNPSGASLHLPGTLSLFSYSQAPSPIITSVSPSSGDAAGGTMVTIAGANFASGASVVFDTTPATNVTVASANSITARAPAHSRGQVSVTVTVPGGLTYTQPAAFTYTGNATTITDTGTTTVTTTGTTGTQPPTSTTPPTSPGGTTTGGNNGGGTTLTTDQIIAADKAVEVTVTRDSDDNVVAFTLPTNLPASPQGVQVFRANSPFVLVATLDKTSVDFQSRSYLDAGAPVDSRYLVTVYYANGQGKATSAPSDIAGFDSLGDGVQSSAANSAKLTLIGYILVVVLAVFLAVLLVVLVLRGRNRPPSAETVPAGAPPPATDGGVAGEDANLRHSVNCPNCGSIFEAYGPKPLRMECPTCGKAGVLR